MTQTEHAEKAEEIILAWMHLNQDSKAWVFEQMRAAYFGERAALGWRPEYHPLHYQQSGRWRTRKNSSGGLEHRYIPC